MDNIALIDDLDEFINDVSANAHKLGFSPASSSVVPAFSGVNDTTVNLSWNTISSAYSYRINVFNAVNDTYLYKETKTSTSRSVDIPVVLGEKIAVQIVALNSSATPVGASRIAYFDNSVYVPEILGATFNDAADIRFVGNTPDKILPDYTVKGYGAVIVPTKYLSGELTLDTPSSIVTCFDETPALRSQFYATVNGIGKNTDLKLAARAYITYEDASGKEFTVYGKNTIVRSVDTISEKMATAVLMYYDAKQQISEYNDTVNEATTHLDLEKLDANGIIAFAKQNRNAIKKAYDLLTLTKDTESKFNQRIDFVYVYETDNYTYGIDRNYVCSVMQA